MFDRCSTIKILGQTVFSMVLLASDPVLAQNSGDFIMRDVGSAINDGIKDKTVACGYARFSIGQTICNDSQDTDMWWKSDTVCADPDNVGCLRPAFGFALYRLKNNTIEQIGMSWAKLGSSAADASKCNTCNATKPNFLDRWCSDTYTRGFNWSDQWYERSNVNARKGIIRSAVQQTDNCGGPGNPDVKGNLAGPVGEFSTSPDETYYAEVQVLHHQDVKNDEGNVGYREVVVDSVSPTLVSLSFAPQSATVTGSAAIRAWQAEDPTAISVITVNDPEGGILLVGCKRPYDLGFGFWLYEYAVENLTSDRAVKAFEINIPNGSLLVQNVGFHDINYHSGAAQDGTDWDSLSSCTQNPDECVVTWTAKPPGAGVPNYLRWGTLYNFRFQSIGAPNLDPGEKIQGTLTFGGAGGSSTIDLCDPE